MTTPYTTTDQVISLISSPEYQAVSAMEDFLARWQGEYNNLMVAMPESMSNKVHLLFSCYDASENEELLEELGYGWVFYSQRIHTNTKAQCLMNKIKEGVIGMMNSEEDFEQIESVEFEIVHHQQPTDELLYDHEFEMPLHQ